MNDQPQPTKSHKEIIEATALPGPLRYAGDPNDLLSHPMIKGKMDAAAETIERVPIPAWRLFTKILIAAYRAMRALEKPNAR